MSYDSVYLMTYWMVQIMVVKMILIFIKDIVITVKEWQSKSKTEEELPIIM